MKKTIVVLSGAVALGLAMIGLYSSCGSTSSDVSPTEALGQFFNQSCSGGNCLTLTSPNVVPADGRSISGFQARLIDGSGVPIVGQEICFAFENPGVAVITEPTNACGLTDANGGVSGQFRVGTTTGSFQLVANAPGGFALRASKEIDFGTPGTQSSGGGGCQLASDCPSGECSAGAVCGGNTCCLGGSGAPCTVPAQCASSLSCINGSCALPSTPVPATPTVAPALLPRGGSCTAGSQCSSHICGSGGTSGLCSSATCCLGSSGDPCVPVAGGADCASGTCNGVTSTCT